MTLVDIELQRFGDRPIIVQRGLTPREAKRALRDAAKEACAAYNPETATVTTDKYYLRIK